jgi:hypothetical protein
VPPLKPNAGYQLSKPTFGWVPSNLRDRRSQGRSISEPRAYTSAVFKMRDANSYVLRVGLAVMSSAPDYIAIHQIVAMQL